jgi:predicted nucleic acid-binding protein
MVVDSSVVLAYLTGGEAASKDAQELFEGFIKTGRNIASISTITVGEILVRPFRQGSRAVAIAESFLRHFGDIAVVDVTYAVAREAARIRALTGLRMPDAFVVASALEVDADLLVTSDHSWRKLTADALRDTRLVELPVARHARR